MQWNLNISFVVSVTFEWPFFPYRSKAFHKDIIFITFYNYRNVESWAVQDESKHELKVFTKPNWERLLSRDPGVHDTSSFLGFFFVIVQTKHYTSMKQHVITRTWQLTMISQQSHQKVCNVTCRKYVFGKRNTRRVPLAFKVKLFNYPLT